jgi:hypothetical protein
MILLFRFLGETGKTKPTFSGKAYRSVHILQIMPYFTVYANCADTNL